MLILSIESSAKAASAALCRDGELLAQSFQRSGLTHSRTLLPMIEDMLKNTETDKSAIDVVAVACGPGSFTGVRIGVSTAKGLCWGLDKPAIGVSTLEAMAWLSLSAGESPVICPAMDARRSQVYNALFEIRNGAVRRLCPDRAISASDLAEEFRALERPVWVLGDGWKVCSDALDDKGVSYTLAPEIIRWQNAWGVAMAAEGKTLGPAAACDDPVHRLVRTYVRASPDAPPRAVPRPAPGPACRGFARTAFADGPPEVRNPHPRTEIKKRRFGNETPPPARTDQSSDRILILKKKARPTWTDIHGNAVRQERTFVQTAPAGKNGRRK